MRHLKKFQKKIFPKGPRENVSLGPAEAFLVPANSLSFSGP